MPQSYFGKSNPSESSFFKQAKEEKLPPLSIEKWKGRKLIVKPEDSKISADLSFFKLKFIPNSKMLDQKYSRTPPKIYEPIKIVCEVNKWIGKKLFRDPKIYLEKDYTLTHIPQAIRQDKFKILGKVDSKSDNQLSLIFNPSNKQSKQLTKFYNFEGIATSRLSHVNLLCKKILQNKLMRSMKNDEVFDNNFSIKSALSKLQAKKMKRFFDLEGIAASGLSRVQLLYTKILQNQLMRSLKNDEVFDNNFSIKSALSKLQAKKMKKFFDLEGIAASGLSRVQLLYTKILQKHLTRSLKNAEALDNNFSLKSPRSKFQAKKMRRFFDLEGIAASGLSRVQLLYTKILQKHLTRSMKNNEAFDNNFSIKSALLKLQAKKIKKTFNLEGIVASRMSRVKLLYTKFQQNQLTRSMKNDEVFDNNFSIKSGLSKLQTKKIKKFFDLDGIAASRLGRVKMFFNKIHQNKLTLFQKVDISSDDQSKIKSHPSKIQINRLKKFFDLERIEASGLGRVKLLYHKLQQKRLKQSLKTDISFNRHASIKSNPGKIQVNRIKKFYDLEGIVASGLGRVEFLYKKLHQNSLKLSLKGEVSYDNQSIKTFLSKFQTKKIKKFFDLKGLGSSGLGRVKFLYNKLQQNFLNRFLPNDRFKASQEALKSNPSKFQVNKVRKFINLDGIAASELGRVKFFYNKLRQGSLKRSMRINIRSVISRSMKPIQSKFMTKKIKKHFSFGKVATTELNRIKILFNNLQRNCFKRFVKNNLIFDNKISNLSKFNFKKVKKFSYLQGLSVSDLGNIKRNFHKAQQKIYAFAFCFTDMGMAIDNNLLQASKHAIENEILKIKNTTQEEISTKKLPQYNLRNPTSHKTLNQSRFIDSPKNFLRLRDIYGASFNPAFLFPDRLSIANLNKFKLVRKITEAKKSKISNPTTLFLKKNLASQLDILKQKKKIHQEAFAVAILFPFSPLSSLQLNLNNNNNEDQLSVKATGTAQPIYNTKRSTGYKIQNSSQRGSFNDSSNKGINPLIPGNPLTPPIYGWNHSNEQKVSSLSLSGLNPGDQIRIDSIQASASLGIAKSSSLLPLPPINLNAVATIAGHIRLSWERPTKGAYPIRYKIYCNERLIGHVKDSDNLHYDDDNNKGRLSSLYGVSSVSSNEMESSPSTLKVEE